MYQHENIFEADAEADVFEMDEYEGEEEWDNGEIFNEADLMELSAQLLEVNTEEELNYFLGGFIGKAASALGSAVRSPVGQALGGILKNAAK